MKLQAGQCFLIAAEGRGFEVLDPEPRDLGLAIGECIRVRDLTAKDGEWMPVASGPSFLFGERLLLEVLLEEIDEDEIKWMNRKQLQQYEIGAVQALRRGATANRRKRR